MPLQPLPIEILTAAKLRRQAKELILLAEELEASVQTVPRKYEGFRLSKKNMMEGRVKKP